MKSKKNGQSGFSIEIDKRSDEPKYIQIVQAILSSIESGKLKRGALLPSITELSDDQKTAKSTVVKAYEQLRQRGIIKSQHGKGFYVSKTGIKHQLNIFLLFDNLNIYKEILYTSFKNYLPKDTLYSIFFHHYDKHVFENLINDNLHNFNYYVIMPHFDEDMSSVIRVIPSDKLLILDKSVPRLAEDYAAVYQDFEKDIIKGLQGSLEQLKKYHKINFVMGDEHFQYVPKGLIDGFKKFVKQHSLPFKIFHDLKERDIVKGEAYLIFSDADMVRFIKYISSQNLLAGQDVGLISYDDTPLKEILLGGITVITTDFETMGRTAARLIRDKSTEKLINPSKLILRKTL